MELFKTERLSFSRFTLADAPFLLELLNSPAWLKYIGDRNVKTIADAEKYLSSKMLPAYEKDGLAGWKITLKSSGETIGNCGFFQRDFLEAPDLGFAFLPQFFGKGYGYEAAKGCLDYAVENLGLQSCCAITSPANKPSIGLLEKLGFVNKGMVNWPDSGEELLLYDWELKK